MYARIASGGLSTSCCDSVCQPSRHLPSHLFTMVHVCVCACADNAQFYADNGVSFVMGTTGGDTAAVAAAAEAGGVYAIVSPQMGKQVREGDRS